MDVGIIAQFVAEVLQKPSVAIIRDLPAELDTALPTAAPAKPYCRVKVSSDKEQGRPISEVESISPTEVNQLMSTYNIANCELQFYSNNSRGEFSAQNLAKYFITATGFQRSILFQKNNGFGLLNPGQRINADIAMGDIIERREIVEFTVNYVYTISDMDVDFFSKAEITLNQVT